MKRTPITTLPLAFALTVFLALVIGPGLPAFGHPGHDPAGKGMGSPARKMHGRGAGMMPYLQGMLAKLPQEKREQVRQLHLAMKRQMNTRRAELQNLKLDMREVMRTFPLDRQAALKTRKAMQNAKDEMFALRLDTVARVQQIVGREAWEEAHAGMMSGHGMGKAGAMGGGGHQQ